MVQPDAHYDPIDTTESLKEREETIMSEHSPAATSAFDAPVREPDGSPVFAPYDAPAGGWGALRATARALREQSIALKGSKTLLSINQPDGFDCPGCAWPDPQHASSFEFCENGAKAVAFELTRRRVTREFFAAHTVRELENEATTGWSSRDVWWSRCATTRRPTITCRSTGTRPSR